MIYLLFAILSSSSIALIFKYTEGDNLNRYLVTSSNYMVALLISIFTIVREGTGPKASVVNPFSLSAASNDKAFSIAIFLGVIVGLLYLSSFILYQVSVRRSGASVSGMAMKLGILVPVTFSIIIWKEYPSIVNALGIVLASIAVIVINYNKEESIDFSSSIFLLFLIGGLAEFSSKLFQVYSLMSYQPIFLSVLFFTAFVFSLILFFYKNTEFQLKAVIMGALVGIPNMLSAYFMILSLQTIEASLAFPIFSAGTILVITIGSVILYGERLMKKDYAALLFTILGLVLLNI